MDAFLSLSRGLRRRAGLALLSVSALVGICYGPGALAEPKVHNVVIEGMRFSPEVLEVSAGDTVVWTNKDLFPHDATASDGSFRSSQLGPDQSWRFKADKKGVFPYLCTLHPTMKASLVVR